MTDRLYYRDPYLHAFDATIERVERRGDLVAVTLDRTAFYPTSGGQPFDTGVLDASRVVDVVDDEDGSIAHLVAHLIALLPLKSVCPTHLVDDRAAHVAVRELRSAWHLTYIIADAYSVAETGTVFPLRPVSKPSRGSHSWTR